jgi:hypothetical protein
MTVNELMTHLQELINEDPSVGELPVYAADDVCSACDTPAHSVHVLDASTIIPIAGPYKGQLIEAWPRRLLVGD